MGTLSNSEDHYEMQHVCCISSWSTLFTKDRIVKKFCKSYPVSHEIYGPAYETLVSITYVSSECSDQPVYLLSLTRAFAAYTHKVGMHG